jgi:hypothetical protein
MNSSAASGKKARLSARQLQSTFGNAVSFEQYTLALIC